MYGVILTLHCIVCFLVILIVLIQAGRSGGFSGLMGGGGGDALFTASSQQSGLRKATVALAALFMATSFFLTVLSSRRSGRSVFSNMPTGTLPAGIPATPGAGSAPAQPLPAKPNPNATSDRPAPVPAKAAAAAPKSK
jgi:preprotein translocase subunit SecG